MRILGGRCLIKLAPVRDRTASGLFLEPALTPPVCYGKVVQIGPKVTDVKVGDIVAFPPSVGEPLDGFFPTPHVIADEANLRARIEPEAQTV